MGKEGEMLQGDFPTPLHELLDVLISKEIPSVEKKRRLEDDFGIAVTGKMKGEMNDMCNLSEMWERRGMEKGMEKGMKSIVVAML